MCADVYIVKVTDPLTLSSISVFAAIFTEEFMCNLLCEGRESKAAVREKDRRMKKGCHHMVRTVESTL